MRGAGRSLNYLAMAFTDKEKSQVDALVKQWLDVDINSSSREEITLLHQKGDYATLDKKLSNRIAFGTAGLRSSMEPGFAHMNDVTILQASQGLIKYLQNQENPSIVVGYDHRYHSQRFAEITASVALVSGFTVHYLGSASNLSEESDPQNSNDSIDRLYVHTPLVPFSIDLIGSSAGVMVTASHNPAKDNGYKVYYGNGCQIIPPHDRNISESIDQNLSPWLNKGVWDVKKNFDEGLKTGKLKLVKEKVTAKYVEAVKNQLIKENKLSFGFVYTPMHGVGLEIFNKVYEQFDTQSSALHVVPEQSKPDPEFPSVPFPNPEEKGALDLAIALAKKQGVKLVVASDPDADRFSVAIERRALKKWQQLTGNEIGILFAAYVIEVLTEPSALKNTYLVNSTVSSQLLLSMAQKLGFHFQDTLTGFKWIGNKAIDLKKEGYNVPFGYEEAIGYMFSIVNDKDGIAAAVMWLQLYETWFAGKDADPIDRLEEIYRKYGWSKEHNGYYRLDDLLKTPKIFNETIRKSYGEGRKSPKTVGDFDVVAWRDLTVGYDSTTADGVPVLPLDSSSQMITATLHPQIGYKEGENVRFTCRGSGTEPKLKVYIEGTSHQGEANAQALARKCWETLRDEWFKPKENGITEVTNN